MDEESELFKNQLHAHKHHLLQELQLLRDTAAVSDYELIRNNCLKLLKSKKVILIKPIYKEGLFDNFIKKMEAHVFDDEYFIPVPFEGVPIDADGIAVSYRHGGRPIKTSINGKVIEINSNALLALQHGGKLNRPMWLDCFCIPLSQHTLKYAFDYMGCLYSCLPVYSQVNWIEAVDDYMSRGWVMQEFLLAQQLLSPQLKESIESFVKQITIYGKKLEEVLLQLPCDVGDHVSLRKVSSELELIMNVLPSLLTTRECKIIEYLANDMHYFWLEQMFALTRLLKDQLQEIAKDENGGSKSSKSSNDIDDQKEKERFAKRLEVVKLCACIPRCFFVTDDVLQAVFKLQSPSSKILGRLEYAYMTAKLTEETDRPQAIFGIFNFLNSTLKKGNHNNNDIKDERVFLKAVEVIEEERQKKEIENEELMNLNDGISGVTFAGVWPSLRGCKVLSSLSFPHDWLEEDLRSFSLLNNDNEEIHLIVMLLEELADDEAQDPIRVVILAVQKLKDNITTTDGIDVSATSKPIVTHLWTYSNLNTNELNTIFDNNHAAMYAHEIDGLMNLAVGTIDGKVFERLRTTTTTTTTTTTVNFVGSKITLKKSRYRFLTSFGDKSIPLC